MLYHRDLQALTKRGDDNPRILDPKEDPDFIFARAQELRSQGRAASPDSDPAVDRVLRFLEMMDGANPIDVYKIRTLFESLFQAMILRNHASDIRGLFIECGVLTGASVSDIAMFAAVSEGTIRSYEKLFFNIRARIADDGYIMGAILRSVVSQMQWGSGTAHTKRVVPTPADIWRFIAYTLGWERFVLFTMGHEFMGETAQRIQHLASKGESVKLLTAVLLEEATPVSAPDILDRTLRTAPIRDAIEPTVPVDVDESGVMKELRQLAGAFDIRPADPNDGLGAVEECKLLKAGEQASENDE